MLQFECFECPASSNAKKNIQILAARRSRSFESWSAKRFDSTSLFHCSFFCFADVLAMAHFSSSTHHISQAGTTVRRDLGATCSMHMARPIHKPVCIELKDFKSVQGNQHAYCQQCWHVLTAKQHSSSC